MALIPRPFQRFIGAENVLIALHAVKRSIEIFLLLEQKEKAFREFQNFNTCYMIDENF